MTFKKICFNCFYFKVPNPEEENHLGFQGGGKTRTRTLREYSLSVSVSSAAEFIFPWWLVRHHHATIFSSRESTEVEAAVSIIFTKAHSNLWVPAWCVVVILNSGRWKTSPFIYLFFCCLWFEWLAVTPSVLPLVCFVDAFIRLFIPRCACRTLPMALLRDTLQISRML